MSAESGGRHPQRRLPVEVEEAVAAWLRLVAEPTRIRLMRLLDGGPQTVQELTAKVPTTHQNVSRHLGVLYQAGLVRRHKHGTSMQYELNDWTALWLIEQIATSIITGLDDPPAGRPGPAA